ncbi:hypothetical protein BJV77DRAFT_571001 [Russula vinacea]|nr:hypothetical protein BJV77DRAFT_571001 [Russula vinacea]
MPKEKHGSEARPPKSEITSPDPWVEAWAAWAMIAFHGCSGERELIARAARFAWRLRAIECIHRTPSTHLPLQARRNPTTLLHLHQRHPHLRATSGTYNKLPSCILRAEALSFHLVKGKCLSFIHCCPRVFLVYIVGRASEDWSETCLTIPIYVCVLTTV